MVFRKGQIHASMGTGKAWGAAFVLMLFGWISSTGAGQTSRNPVDVNAIALGVSSIPNINWSVNEEAPVIAHSLSGSGSDRFGTPPPGEIFVPAIDTVRIPEHYTAFESGVDDFAHFNIDGQAIVDDDLWTGSSAARVADLSVPNPGDVAGSWTVFELYPRGSDTLSGFDYWGATLNQSGIGQLVSPASLRIDVIPEPTAGVLSIIGGCMLLRVRRRR